MDTIYYVVESIDGDYANLKRTNADSDELKLVARALLPDGIDVGTKLKYEAFEYEVQS
ncbi:MAG: chorismate--pyruvate lyase [Lachnospiraceae bacterium]|nr:chorismate--pyruvate lyase [Lachnospiraceae bacterium]